MKRHPDRISTTNPLRNDSQSYYGIVRKEITPFLPNNCERTLEVGCGTGATLKYLQQKGLATWTCGIEANPDAASIARECVDCLFEGDVEQLNLTLPEESVDLILCLDVLEHLKCPERLIGFLHRLLVPNGAIIASIPNIRHRSALVPLLFRGEWNYKDCGILDKTHLRFFTRESALRLVTSSGLSIDKIGFTYGGEGDRFWDRLSLGLFRPFFELQYLIRVRRVG